MITPPFWPRSINWRASASILLTGPKIRVFVLPHTAGQDQAGITFAELDGIHVRPLFEGVDAVMPASTSISSKGRMSPSECKKTYLAPACL